MRRFLFIVLLILSFIPLKQVTAQSTDPERPNIVFLEVDDLRYDYTSFNGSDLIKTPNIDELAEEGVYFGRASCQGMMCGPSRNSLITGLYPHNLGFYKNGDLRALPEGVWSFPQALQRAGYYTAWLGKCHVRPKGKDKTLAMKNKMGFDFVKLTWGRVMLCKRLKKGKNMEGDWYVEYLKEKGQLDNFLKACDGKAEMKDEDYLDAFFTSQTKDFLSGYNDNKPLFLWINYTLPHGPFDVPEKYHKYNPDDMPGFTTIKNYEEPENLVAKTKYISSLKKMKEYQAGYLANIDFLDKQVGEIVAELKKKGIYDNTVIVFFSDHGLMMGDHHRIHKGTLFNHVTNPNLVISWPGKIRENVVVNDPVELIDLIKTTLSLAKADEKDINKRKTSVNLLPVLFKDEKVDRKYAFGEIEGYVAVTDGRYRLIKGEDGFTLLFDDIEDPSNLVNIADKHPDKVKEMSEAIDKWFKVTGKPLPRLTY